MSSRGSLFAAIFLFASSVALPVHAQKTEAGLLAAWEQEQKSDLATIKFEKTADKTYRFATKHFPFDGELLVRNITIQDPGLAFVGQEFTSGTVEVELVGVKEDFYRTFSVSYGQWLMGNTFYWDSKNSSWVTSQKRLRHIQDDFPLRRGFWTTLLASSGTIIVVLLFIPIVLFLSLLRYNRRIKEINARAQRSLALSERAIQLSERNIQLQEEHARLLQEIRDHLKK
jgi:hypothetical protein